MRFATEKLPSFRIAPPRTLLVALTSNVFHLLNMQRLPVACSSRPWLFAPSRNHPEHCLLHRSACLPFAYSTAQKPCHLLLPRPTPPLRVVQARGSEPLAACRTQTCGPQPGRKKIWATNRKTRKTQVNNCLTYMLYAFTAKPAITQGKVLGSPGIGPRVPCDHRTWGSEVTRNKLLGFTSRASPSRCN